MPLPVIDIKGAEKCPACGSKKHATADYVELLKKGLYLPKDFNESFLQMQVPIPYALTSPFNIQQLMPVIIISFAICGNEKCFCMYVTSIKSTAMPIQQGPQAKAR